MKKLLMVLMGVGLVGIIIPALMASAAELVIQTIPQEDQLRKKGIMILCPPQFPDPNGVLCNAQGFVWNGTTCTNDGGPFNPCELGQKDDPFEVRDLHAEYKIDIRLDGENVTPDDFSCNVIEKEVCHIPPEKGFPAVEATKLFDVGNFFKCVLNEGKDGVGVMEVYYTGNPNDAQFIGDHIVKIEACVGSVCGAEIQDLCILGAPSCGVFDDCTDGDKEPNFKFQVKWSNKREEFIWKFADPIFPFASCKNLAVQQREIYIADPFVSIPECDIEIDP